jgi:hypothetical protein
VEILIQLSLASALVQGVTNLSLKTVTLMNEQTENCSFEESLLEYLSKLWMLDVLFPLVCSLGVLSNLVTILEMPRDEIHLPPMVANPGCFFSFLMSGTIS